MAPHPALEISLNKKSKKQRSENEAEIERELHELPYTEMEKSGNIGLASGVFFFQHGTQPCFPHKHLFLLLLHTYRGFIAKIKHYPLYTVRKEMKCSGETF